MAKITRLRDLTPDKKNSNKGTERGTGMLEQSLRTYGAGRSILIDAKGRIIAGNKTVQEAATIGMDKVQVVESDGTTIIAVQRTDLDLERDAKARELALADNRIAEVNLDYDKAVLGELAQELDLDKFFLENELKDLLEPDEAEEPEQAPNIGGAEELQQKWHTERGQIWQVGDHRVMCGDSTSAEDVTALMDGKLAHMVHTDPPFGIDYAAVVASRRNQKRGGWDQFKSDELKGDDFALTLEKVFKNAFRHTVEEAAFCSRDEYLLAMRNAALMEAQYIVWVKDSFTFGWADYAWQTELCSYAHKQGKKPAFYGSRQECNIWQVATRDADGRSTVSVGTGVRLSNGRGAEIFVVARTPKQKKIRLVRIAPNEELILTTDSQGGDLWRVAHDTASSLHPTMKPAELAVRAIRNSSTVGQLVFEPFGGAGSTMIGAHLTQRSCYAMEIEPKYVGVILERMTGFGLTPQLLDDEKRQPRKRESRTAVAERH